jgi:hypothetical protein
MDSHAESHIMIAHPLTADEALALLAQPAVAVRVTPESVRANRFHPVGRSAPTGHHGAAEVAS